MDPVTQLKIDALLHLVVYPALALAAVAAGGIALRRKAEHPERPGVLALALAGAAVVSFVGSVAVPAVPPVDTRDFTPLFTLLLPLPFLALERRPRLGLIAPLAALSVAAMLYLYLRPILGGEYAPADRVAEAGALGLAVWLASDRLATVVPAPVSLATMGLGAAGAGVVSMLSGTATIGQGLGGVALVAALGAVLTWRVPRLTVGRAAVAAVLVPFLGLLAYAHFYSDVPPQPALVVCLAPLTAAVALPFKRVLPAALVAAALAALPAVGGAYLAKSASDEKLAKEAAESGGTAEPDYSILMK